MLDRDRGGYYCLRGSRCGSRWYFGRFLATSSKHVPTTNCSMVCLAIVSLTLARKSGKSQAPNARRFALILQVTVVVSRFTLLRYRFTGYWLALCINERARPSLPSGRGGLSLWMLYGWAMLKYSCIKFPFQLLNRPVVHLIPEGYKQSRCRIPQQIR